MSARRIIVDAIVNHPFDKPSPGDIANYVCERLHAAGYRLIGPGELDRETVEHALNVVDQHRQSYAAHRDDLIARGKANAAGYANLVAACDSITKGLTAALQGGK